VRNNPINFIDPTGHWDDEGCGYGNLCELPESESPPPPPPDSNGEIINDDDDNDLPIVFQPLGTNSDYYSLIIYHGFPGWLLGIIIAGAGLAEPSPVEELGAFALANWLDGGINLTIDKYGRLFVSPGLSIGYNSIEQLPTISILAGNLMTDDYQGLPILNGGSPTDIEKLLGEFSTSHNFSHPFFPNIGSTRSPAAPYNSIELGWGFPGHVTIIDFSYGVGPFQIIE
jgi:hypothetical protein